MASSMLARSSSVSVTLAAPALSSRYLRRLVPGMGTMSSPWASSHARASCPGVIPLPSATARTLSASSTFFWKFSSAKRGKRALRVSFSGKSSMLLQRPVRKPRPSRLEGADGVHGMGLLDGLCRRFGEPEIPDLARFHKLLHRTDRLLDGRLRVHAVLVVEVDVVDL